MVRREMYGRLAGYYDVTHEAQDYKGQADFVDTVFQERGTSGRRVLDVGCGTGEHTRCMIDKGYVAVYLTNPDRPFDRPVESLSIAERIGHGGPWMSVESCAIHLNNLLVWGYAPLVVEDEGQVIAETEFYIGRDIPPLGTTLDISVLYVHLDFQRQGAGSLLMEEMIARARNAGCDHITALRCAGTTFRSRASPRYWSVPWTSGTSRTQTS